MDRFASKVVIALVVCSLACGKKEPERVSSTTFGDPIHVPDGLPLAPPPGWEVLDHPTQSGKMLLLPKTNDFSPCINLLEDSYSGSLDEFVDSNVASLRQMTNQYRQLKREPFQTDGGISGIKLSCTSVTNNVQLFFSYYLFDWNADSKRVFTCCSLATQSKTMEPVFDEILKTYHPE